MPLGRIEIEEVGAGRWIAEVEAGGTAARRDVVRAETIEGIIDAAYARYREFVPEDRVPAPAVVSAPFVEPVAAAGEVAEVSEPARRGPGRPRVSR
jgi:hypothetical protein